MKDPVKWVEDQFKDLEGENTLLKAELKKALSLEEYPVKKIKPGWKRRAGKFQRIVVIPDTQVKAGVPMEHLTWAGKFILDRKPDIVVHIGDHWDFPSLSYYDRGKKCFEGRRFKTDIDAGNEGMNLLTREYRGKKRTYTPEEHFFMGNHENRVDRVIEESPWLEDIVSLKLCDLRGWQVHKFLEPADIQGVLFCHYFYNPRNGKPWTGMAETVLKNVGRSFVQGHRQGLSAALHQLPTGGRRRGVVAGSFYIHNESYLGEQGDHWRGILELNEVLDGDFDLAEVSLDYLRRKYG